jgi:RNA polymerase sigma-70 factor (ECF subfamily)
MLNPISRCEFSSELAALRPGLVSRALWMTSNPADAEDLAQTAILRALEHRGALEQNEASVGAWTQVVLRRLVIDQFRSTRRRRVHPEIDSAGLEAPVSEAAPRWMAFTMDQLLTAVQRCPPLYRCVYELHDIEGRSYGDIARELSIPISTVGTRLRRARLRIRALIELDADAAEVQRGRTRAMRARKRAA